LLAPDPRPLRHGLGTQYLKAVYLKLAATRARKLKQM